MPRSATRAPRATPAGHGFALRALGALYLAGAALPLIGTLFPGSPRADALGLLAVFVTAASVGAGCWLGAGRAPAGLARARWPWEAC